MFGEVARKLMSNFLYWYLRTFARLNSFSAKYGVHKAALSQKSTYLQCRHNWFKSPRPANSHLDWVTACMGLLLVLMICTLKGA